MTQELKTLQAEVIAKQKDNQRQKIREEAIELTENVLDFSISDRMYYGEFRNSDFQRVMEKIQEGIYEQEIIYYSRAIQYLYDNDPSLTESLSLAENYGFTLKDLNSEKLATLLYQENLTQELRKIEEDLKEIREKANELEEEKEGEE